METGKTNAEETKKYYKEIEEMALSLFELIPAEKRELTPGTKMHLDDLYGDCAVLAADVHLIDEQDFLQPFREDSDLDAYLLKVCQLYIDLKKVM